MTKKRQNYNWLLGGPQGSAMFSLSLMIALVLGTTLRTQAQTFEVLYTFQQPSDGNAPYAPLTRDATGNLYGITIDGGNSNGPCQPHGCGVVFRLSPAGKEAIYSFTGGTTDGAHPMGSVVLDSTGNVYGTTNDGGSFGQGIVFEISKSGKETVLYNFAGGTADGCNPEGGLIQDSEGNLVGTTSSCGTTGYGNVFKLTKQGVETVWHNFMGPPSDAGYPYLTNVLLDAQGNLYGVTYHGGQSDRGAVYKLRANGTVSLLYGFTGGADGGFAGGDVAMDGDGNLYGTTQDGGTFGVGTVWKVSTSGVETVLHSFENVPDGASPLGGVIRDASGNLYGDAIGGGVNNQGMVFKVDASGQETVLHSFAVKTDGAFPVGNLIGDAKCGCLYGTTFGAVGYDNGTVWVMK